MSDMLSNSAISFLRYMKVEDREQEVGHHTPYC